MRPDIRIDKDVLQLDLSVLPENLQDFLRRVRNGETIVILESGEPIAEIRPPDSFRKRPFGLCAGEFRVPDDF
ncbi:MAG: type II toxin-antitoxin system Phd/YefM family antitoxin [Thermoflexales bacterium]|nr:type II toxin-antitoxin system Phd/YefM family antitoxin [Thermoflexales bacterium]